MEEKVYITLKCRECENTTCKLNKQWLHPDSQCGCTREVSEETSAQYQHLMYEVAPFMDIDTTQEYQKRTYNEIIDFLDYIYSCPLGQKIKDTKRLGK